MANYDLFNGDADGICALTQLRNANPVDSTLITGVKRSIDLLKQVTPAEGDQITVLDVSMDKNKEPLLNCLEKGAEVFYVDHHFPGDIPEHPKLTAIINETPDVCTSLLMDQYLNGQFKAWAVVGTFGDNLKKSAKTLAKPLALSDDKLQQLENLGIYINYNGYGSNLEDLLFNPEELFRIVSQYADPFDFIHNDKAHFQTLEVGYNEDMGAAESLKPLDTSDKTAVFMLPDEPWARRVSGVYSNDLTNLFPARAHAVLTEKATGTYLVSVRAPLDNKKGAADLCRQFPTGGGREAAAGINDLPGDQLDAFIDAFKSQYG